MWKLDNVFPPYWQRTNSLQSPCAVLTFTSFMGKVTVQMLSTLLAEGSRVSESW